MGRLFSNTPGQFSRSSCVRGHIFTYGHVFFASIYRSPQSTRRKTSAELLQRESTKSADLDFERILSAGIPVQQHKSRKALMGSAGSKPRSLVLSRELVMLSLLKRGNEGSAEDDEDHTVEVSQVRRSDEVALGTLLLSPVRSRAYFY